MALLLVHLTATAALAGLVRVVQLVVHPSCRLDRLRTAAWTVGTGCAALLVARAS